MGLLGGLSEEAVCMDLRAESREDALRELLGRLVEGGKLAEEKLAPAMKALMAREAVGSTAIGRGIALPHARADLFDGTLVSLGLSREGVEFSALDGEPVHAIFLVLGPEGAADEYLAVLQDVSRLIQNADFRRFLGRARTSGEVLELIGEMGG